MVTEMKTKNQTAMMQAMNDPDMEICQACKTIYRLEILKPGEDYNDFGIRYCPYCGNSTQTLPDCANVQTQANKNFYIFITLSGGLIEQVKYYTNPLSAIKTLSSFVKAMNPEDQDAGVYDKEGMIATAKDFLDENDEFMENPEVFERF